MPEDTFTEVTSESWFSRLGGAFKGIVFGIVLVAVAFPLHFWNEGRAVRTYKTLKEGGGSVVTVPADPVDLANEGKLVHLTGLATTDQTLRDLEFDVSAQALKLQRTVEMYQWDEHQKSTAKKKVGGGTETSTEYTYSKKWSESLIDSSGFKKAQGHENPKSMRYRSAMQVAAPIHLGAFTLSTPLIREIRNFTNLNLDAGLALPDSLQDIAKRQPNGFYIGTNPVSPSVGDVRITFRSAPPTQVSVIAKQVGNTFGPYVAEASGTIEMLETGVHTAEAMIQAAQDRNTKLTWILRGVGFLFTLIGLNMIFRPLSVMADVLPILGNLVGAGTGIVALFLAAIVSLVTIAVAWVVFRPVLGASLIVGAVILLLLLIKKMRGAGGGKPGVSWDESFRQEKGGRPVEKF